MDEQRLTGESLLLVVRRHQRRARLCLRPLQYKWVVCAV